MTTDDHRTSQRTDRRPDGDAASLSPEQRRVDDLLARDAALDRGRAPDALEEGILQATAPIVGAASGANRRRAPGVLASIGFRLAAAAAVAALLGAGVWFVLPSPAPTSAPNREAIAEQPEEPPIETELELIFGEEEPWPALATPEELDELDVALTRLATDRASFWPELNDPIVEESL